MKDYLEDDVGEGFYILTEKAGKLVDELIKNGTLDPKHDFEMDGNFNQRGKVHGEGSICRTIFGGGHAGNEPKVCIDLTDKEPSEKKCAAVLRQRTGGYQTGDQKETE